MRIGLALLLLCAGGCLSMPEHVTVRDPSGTALATMNTKSGEVRLTWVGLQMMRPQFVLQPPR